MPFPLCFVLSKPGLRLYKGSLSQRGSFGFLGLAPPPQPSHFSVKPHPLPSSTTTRLTFLMKPFRWVPLSSQTWIPWRHMQHWVHTGVRAFLPLLLWHSELLTGWPHLFSSTQHSAWPLNHLLGEQINKQSLKPNDDQYMLILCS